ncbi:MAG: ferredoxin [Candidatus Aenigmatarchaeota archaeon]
MAKVIVNKDECIGCSTCAAICPQAFEMKDSKAIAKPNAEKAACIKKAIEACPVQCIKMK